MKAVSLGGVNVTCGLKASEADDEAVLVDVAKENKLMVIRFSAGDGAKLVEAINAKPPATTMKAERIIAFKGDDKTVLAVVNGGRLCLFKGSMPTGMFEKLEDDVFGAGS